jgi:hypothetical protein
MIAFKRSTRVAGFFLLMALVCSQAAAQERGQYLPGFRGLNASAQPPPGFTYANYFFWYPTDTFKNRDGDKAPIDFSLDLLADVNLFVYTPKAKVLGGTYAITAAVPILNTPVSLPRIESDIGGVGLGDVYIEPLSLGWKLSKGNARVAYGFVAPTGRFNEALPTTPHQITGDTRSRLAARSTRRKPSCGRLRFRASGSFTTRSVTKMSGWAIT